MVGGWSPHSMFPTLILLILLGIPMLTIVLAFIALVAIATLYAEVGR